MATHKLINSETIVTANFIEKFDQGPVVPTFDKNSIRNVLAKLACAISLAICKLSFPTIKINVLA